MKILQKLKSIMPTKRKLMQLYFALLFNAHLKGFVTGNIYKGNTKTVCAPGINCYSCPGAVAACPLGSLQGSFSADKSTIFYVGGILLLYCVIFGRTICGWLCPFGFIQELFYKLRTPKLKKNRFTRILSFLKYVFLVFFVFIVPITYALRNVPLPAFCKYVCPAGTLEGGIGLLAHKVNEGYFSMLGPLFTWKFALMVSILVGCVFVFRLFCRFICPLGALYGLFNRISILGVKVEAPKCTHCQKCVSHCRMDIKSVGDAECIGCGECIDVCPTKAIVWKGSQIFVRGNDIPEKTDNKPIGDRYKKRRTVTRAISTVVLLGILVGSFVFYHNDDSGEASVPVISDSSSDSDVSSDLPEYGNTLGTRCYGADLTVVTADGVGAETVNPVSSGKITVINFWGTWCTPCVNELPYFDAIASEYADSVSVYAIHTEMVVDTASAFIGEYYPESKIIFACDGKNEFYYSMLGGRGTYPYTVILDEKGVIVSIHLAAVDHETLKTEIESILSNED
ncbi:MAG: 4Fe-4S binding protein [Clostridia bacterium]|nr:4Fe-4S binding protein [Clostridia bacterium]